MGWFKELFAPPQPQECVTGYQRARECECGQFYRYATDPLIPCSIPARPIVICPHCGRYYTKAKLVTGRWHYTHHSRGCFGSSHNEYTRFEKAHDA
jgi:hypothetical protein